METRTVADSKITMSQSMLPGDANQFGFVHGGTIMKLVDTAAGVVAIRHARCRVATARVDTMSFLAPARVGDVVTVHASVNDVGRTSLEVGTRVDVEDPLTGRVTHTSSAYITMVALDEHNRPVEVPRLIAETPDEKRRMAAARVRRMRREWSRRPAHQGHPEHAGGQLAGVPAAVIDWPPRGNPNRPIVVGHRGAAAHAPENTVSSFEKGLALGADVLECDVHLTRDGRLAVIHDHTVDRTTNGTGLVGGYTLAELKALDAGIRRGPEFAGQRILELPELLALARGRARVSIEVKNGPVFYAGIATRLVETLRVERATDDVLVISFDHRVIREVRELCPEVAGGVLYSARPADPAGMARAADAQVLLPHWALVTPEDVEAAHRAGLLLLPWTANTTEQIEALLAMGVDGLASDYPDLVRAAVDGQAAK